MAGILYHGLLGHRNHLTIRAIPTNQPIAIMGSIQLGLFVPGAIPIAGSTTKRRSAPIAAGIMAVNASIIVIESLKKAFVLKHEWVK